MAIESAWIVLAFSLPFFLLLGNVGKTVFENYKLAVKQANKAGP
jgi:hypothetical protein